MPRRSKYTPEVVSRVCELLAEGNTRKTASLLAGISYETFRQWLQTKPAFSAAVQKAEAEAEARHVAIIRQAAAKTWQAAAWWLERRRPEEWGDRSRRRVEVSGPGEGPLRHEHTHGWGAEEWDEYQRLFHELFAPVAAEDPDVRGSGRP